MKNLSFFAIAILFFVPGIALGFNAADIVLYPVGEAYFFQSEFDKLALDITIPSGNATSEDKLLGIGIQNDGKALYSTEVREYTLWEDAGPVGFQGLGIDKKLGAMIFCADNYSWYLNNLSSIIPKSGRRFFVSVETSRIASANTTFQMKVPILQDQNNNGSLESGDLGIYLASKNNGPKDGSIVNQYIQTIRNFSLDNLGPKVAITAPLDGAVIATGTYKIIGAAKDQGGSSPQWIKIAINEGDILASTGNWQDVKGTSDNYGTWEYDWTGIEEGVYNIKTKAADWLDNVKTSEAIIVTVVFPKPEAETITPITPIPPITPTSTPSSTDTSQPAQTVSIIDQIKAKIAVLQELIAQLMLQLIEILKEQIAMFKR